ncbi:MAG: thioredoxin domain-containing protein [Gemmataceae bacterium]|nr:thioredoxin domain-containing protein [Gemmataceae bacterium]
MRRLLFASALVAAFAAIILSAPAQAPKTQPKFTNRLAKEASPYLLLHAHNPTDWYPWGPEAFDKARKENKPIFLSIGYSSCYWCHVMERESFANEEVAKLLNGDFICIKVDREERPDIDHIYMTALTTFRSGGGWPLSMFLTPDGRPIVGGTYWPREDRVVEEEKSSGFKSIIKVVANAWKNEKDSLEKQADKIAALTKMQLDNVVPGIALVDLDRKLLETVLENLKDEFDPEYGGFGNPNRNFRGTKFPLPSRLNLLLRQAETSADKEALKMVTLTLDRMAHSGIYDQIGGGFHRYSTERTWNIPHFEKMLYDNAQLVETYSHAYRLTKKPAYRRIVQETLTYVEREMTSPAGAFYSSQDAETHHEEGRFHVWTPAELEEALPAKEELDLANSIYAAGGKVNFEGKYHILALTKPMEQTAKDRNMTEDELLAKLKPIRARLFASREKRDKPLRNEMALTAWSGQMIAGYAEAGRSLDEKKYLDAARRAADFVLKHQKTADGRLLRTYGAAPGGQPKASVPGYLEDYAFLTHGLLSLHEATKEPRWLEEAKSLTQTMLKHHGDTKRGGFFMSADDAEKLFARSKDQYDGAQPSGNSQAAMNLVRLARLTGEERWAKEAERTLKAFAGTMKVQGSGMTLMAQALDEHLAVKKK